MLDPNVPGTANQTMLDWMYLNRPMIPMKGKLSKSNVARKVREAQPDRMIIQSLSFNNHVPPLQPQSPFSPYKYHNLNCFENFLDFIMTVFPDPSSEKPLCHCGKSVIPHASDSKCSTINFPETSNYSMAGENVALTSPSALVEGRMPSQECSFSRKRIPSPGPNLPYKKRGVSGKSIIPNSAMRSTLHQKHGLSAEASDIKALPKKVSI